VVDRQDLAVALQELAAPGDQADKLVAQAPVGPVGPRASLAAPGQVATGEAQAVLAGKVL
jgi:hypothetical protein